MKVKLRSIYSFTETEIYVWFGGKPYHVRGYSGDGWVHIRHPDYPLVRDYPGEHMTFVHETTVLEITRNKDGSYTPVEH